jgi:hypothetical protein
MGRIIDVSGRRGRGRCPLLVALLLLAACDGDSGGGWISGDLQTACGRQCISLGRNCTAEASRDRDAKVAACSGTKAEIDACRAEAQRVLDAARSVCTDARTQCSSCCAGSGSGCAAVVPEVPKSAGSFELPDRKDLQSLDLPPGPEGTGYTLGVLPDGVVWMDPTLRTPVTAAAECAGAMLACYEHGVRNYAGCFASVPVCSSDTPWTSDGPACCAAACATRYQELRRQGRDDPTAMVAAIFEKPSCMPGVKGHVPSSAP